MRINKWWGHFISLYMLAFMTSCNFAGDTVGEDGFLMGIWHGGVVLIALIVSIFSDIDIYSSLNSGFFYNLFFLLGVFLLSWNVIGITMGIISIVFLVLQVRPF